MIKFQCASCGKKLGVPDDYAGKKVRCNACKAPVEVPGVAVAAAPVKAAAPAKTKAEPSDEYELSLDDLMPSQPVAPPAVAAAPSSRPAQGGGAGRNAAQAVAEARGTKPCPKCGAAMKDSAVICIQCGHNVKVGMNAKTVAGAKKAAGLAGRTTAALIGGGVAAIAGGVIWAFVARATGLEIAYVAIGIGALVGLVVAIASQAQNTMLGAYAAAMTVVALLIGKVMIVQWALPAIAAGELLEMPGAVEAVVADQMLSRHEIDPGLEQRLQDETLDEAASEAAGQEFAALVQQKVAGMSKAQKKAALQEQYAQVVAAMPLTEQISEVLAPMDALFALFAVAAAFKLGAGITSGE